MPAAAAVPAAPFPEVEAEQPDEVTVGNPHEVRYVVEGVAVRDFALGAGREGMAGGRVGGMEVVVEVEAEVRGGDGDGDGDGSSSAGVTAGGGEAAVGCEDGNTDVGGVGKGGLR